MVGWHHRLNGHEFEQGLGDGEGQRSLACCSPWGHKESDTTERQNTTSPWDIFTALHWHQENAAVSFRNKRGFYLCRSSSPSPRHMILFSKVTLAGYSISVEREWLRAGRGWWVGRESGGLGDPPGALILADLVSPLHIYIFDNSGWNGACVPFVCVSLCLLPFVLM